VLGPGAAAGTEPEEARRERVRGSGLTREQEAEEAEERDQPTDRGSEEGREEPGEPEGRECFPVPVARAEAEPLWELHQRE
jgi:hypothetical protein